MINQGEVWYYKGYKGKDKFVQAKGRYVVVVSNNVGNKYSPVVTVIPLSSKYNKNNLPCHSIIYPTKQNGLKETSMTLTEQILTIDKSSLIEKVGHLSQEDLKKLYKTIELQLGFNYVKGVIQNDKAI